jgi:hypothetical protein
VLCLKFAANISRNADKPQWCLGGKPRDTVCRNRSCVINRIDITVKQRFSAAGKSLIDDSVIAFFEAGCLEDHYDACGAAAVLFANRDAPAFKVTELFYV